MSTLRMKYLWTPYMCILAGFGVADYRGWRCVLARLRSNQEVVVQIARHLTSIAVLALLLAIVSFILILYEAHHFTHSDQDYLTYYIVYYSHFFTYSS